MVSRDYCSLHSRFGFHFVSVEARLGDRTPENYVAFQLRGGAANIERRILRVRFVADLLWEFGLTPVVRNDAVTARLEGMDMEEGQCLLAVAGYLTIHTRQLDMIMQDSAKAVSYTHLSRCRARATRRERRPPQIQETMPRKGRASKRESGEGRPHRESMAEQGMRQKTAKDCRRFRTLSSRGRGMRSRCCAA